ncbi:MAG TPA: M13 family metallopeptidase [Thermoanaerobaculaceae bacterium]|nr:M13 family metallopeptidase [Thermoanaerobaculaceae bacterium]
MTRSLRIGILSVVVAAVALPLAAQEVHGVNSADMDTAAKPCTDFFHYADGGWVKAHPIPAQFPRWGSLNALAEENRVKMHAILGGLATRNNLVAGSEQRKLADFWSACMNEQAVEAAGARPIEPELARIAAIKSATDLQAEVARLQSQGVHVLFGFGSEQDRRNSEEMIAAIRQGGLGLPDRDYYLKDDPRSKEIREKYQAHVARMLGLLGDEAARAKSEAAEVVALETELAKISMARVDLRNPDKTYHRMPAAELAKLAPDFDWPAYFQRQQASQVTSLNVAQPEFVKGVAGLLEKVPLDQWKTYLRWHLVGTAAPHLSSAFVNEDFDFHGKTLQGTEKLEERWERCVELTDHELGFALGKLYVEKYFPPEAKKEADRLVHNLIAALRADIATLDWMGPETKKAAIAKLDAFTPKIGYPDTWRDYSKYEVTAASLADNVTRGNEFEFHRQIDKIGKPVDRTEWGMTPPTVNAYYNPSRNEIVFPAGILQPPFFDAKADSAVNYGAIGAVIGHEMTHGFDDQGRKFDAHGNLKDWWTPEDAKNYEARAACVEKQFDAYEVQPGLHENGKLVLGESIADLGGLTIAHMAYEASLAGAKPPVVGGLTADQRFFLAFGRVWAGSARPEYEQMQVKVDPHPAMQFRAIAAPSNMPQFEAAFGCKPGDPMVRADRCRIW